jgi:DEAD/DEAH box helicase domain-containing protein
MSRARALERSASRTPAAAPADLLTAAVTCEIVDSIVVPPRAAVSAAIPKPYRNNLVLSRLLQALSPDGTIWSHQALALEHVAAGHNLLITTGTGSGKSLAFQLPLLRELTEGEGKALVLYPQKSLSSDQLRRWRGLLDQAQLPSNLVGEINGETPVAQREAILEASRIVLATPDVLHAWFLRLQSAPAAARFLASLRFVAIDEAHVFEGVFGSNSAYFFRRLNLAAAKAQGLRVPSVQYIAASATMGNPIAHIEALTGHSFVHVGEEHNGAPTHGMTLLHLDGPDTGSAAETVLAEILAKLSGKITDSAIVAFLDGRQGVERVARKLANEAIVPYRSGYASEDRAAVEVALGSGNVRACVATSALELGIDVAGFQIGFNLGIARSRGSLRQRIGRVGRASMGAFAVIAPRNGFTKLGTSFADFVTGSVEDISLYLENRAVQFQQAACLLKETGGAAIQQADWPDGFAEIYKALQTNAPLPDDLAALAELCGDSPHHSFSLRQIADVRFALRNMRNGMEEIGTIDLAKALREAYPGATYLHNRKAYKVVGWQRLSFGPSITLQPVPNATRTVPMLLSRTEVSLDPYDLLGGHAIASETGSLSERRVKITEMVCGYQIGSKSVRYSESGQTNRNLATQSRQFESTGVILRCSESWFAGATRADLRNQIAKALYRVLLAEGGLLPSEIGWAQGRISLRTRTGSKRTDDAIVLFDAMPGGLRLTQTLFSGFEGLLERLRKGSVLAGEDRLLSAATIDRLERWYSELKPEGPASVKVNVGGIYAAGSELGALSQGHLIPRRITGHQMVNISGTEQLMYSYDCEDGTSAWVSHDCLRPIGLDWHFLENRSDAAGEVGA